MPLFLLTVFARVISSSFAPCPATKVSLSEIGVVDPDEDDEPVGPSLGMFTDLRNERSDGNLLWMEDGRA